MGIALGHRVNDPTEGIPICFGVLQSYMRKGLNPFLTDLSADFGSDLSVYLVSSSFFAAFIHLLLPACISG
ncbi:unnamed protein product [Protopolystoma xenopodis]|uniref:Uncharacterized protein n=1 Tax=Protopolystoma xenopodis TaxID=117903 RepID=A0A3S5AZQ1_9PLAT|nr:unnamed protein product [Protopolystoma xenopodis]